MVTVGGDGGGKGRINSFFLSQVRRENFQLVPYELGLGCEEERQWGREQLRSSIFHASKSKAQYSSALNIL